MSKLTRIQRRFSTISPDFSQTARIQDLRKSVRRFALELADICPDNAESEKAFDHLRIAMMFATESISYSTEPAEQDDQSRQ